MNLPQIAKAFRWEKYEVSASNESLSYAPKNCPEYFGLPMGASKHQIEHLNEYDVFRLVAMDSIMWVDGYNNMTKFIIECSYRLGLDNIGEILQQRFDTHITAHERLELMLEHQAICQNS